MLELLPELFGFTNYLGLAQQTNFHQKARQPLDWKLELEVVKCQTEVF